MGSSWLIYYNSTEGAGEGSREALRERTRAAILLIIFAGFLDSRDFRFSLASWSPDYV